jgi:hypothetical protein
VQDLPGAARHSRHGCKGETMSQGKNSIYIKDFKPGYVKDFPDTLNPGFKTFKNWIISVTGKLTKAFGWSVVLPYDETGKDCGNLSIDFGRTGFDGYPSISTFHCKPFVTTVGGVEVTYRDVLYHKIVNNINEIWRTRYGPPDIVQNPIIESKKISVDGQFQGKCNIRFVESPDHVYIINDYVSGTVSGTVYKYKYAKDLKQYDADLIQNVSISAAVETWAVKTANSSTDSILGNYLYSVVPVYNTSSEGAMVAREKETDLVFNAIYVNIDNKKLSVTLEVQSSYNPFIIGYKVYRTKVNAVVATVYKNSDNPFDMQKQSVYQAPVPPNKEFYFLGYFPRPNNSINSVNPANRIKLTHEVKSEGVTYNITENNINDKSLGSILNILQPVNLVIESILTTDGYNPSKSFLDSGYGMLCTCGTYADDSMFLGGDARYPKKLFKSEFGKSDTFGSVIYDIKYASLENMQTAIEQVGGNMFVWCKNGGLVKLSPTQSADVPYIVEPLGDGIGCDSINSIAVIGKMAMFVFKNKLYLMNEFGACATTADGSWKEISGGINSILATATSEIVLKTNNKDNYVKIMFRTASLPINIDFYPTLGVWIEHTGKKDIYNKYGVLASLSSASERYGLVNYNYLPDVNEEWGVDVDGNIVKRQDTFINTSVGSDKTQWLNCSTSAIAIKDYNVVSTLERSLHFNAKIYINKIIFYGTSLIKYDYALDTGVYVFAAVNETREITMVMTGYEIAINQHTNLLLLKMIHDTAAEIDFDYIEIVYNGTQKITVKNTVGAGA